MSSVVVKCFAGISVRYEKNVDFMEGVSMMSFAANKCHDNLYKISNS